MTTTYGAKGERYRTRTRRIWGQWDQEKALASRDLLDARQLVREHYGNVAAKSLEAKSGLVRVTIGGRELRAKSLDELLKRLPAAHIVK